MCYGIAIPYWVYTVVSIVYFQFCITISIRISLSFGLYSYCKRTNEIHIRRHRRASFITYILTSIIKIISPSQYRVSSIEYRVSTMRYDYESCYEYSVYGIYLYSNSIYVYICVCIIYSYNCSCTSHSDWGRDSTTSVYLYCTSCTTYCTSLRRSLICTQPSAEACARITPSA